MYQWFPMNPERFAICTGCRSWSSGSPLANQLDRKPKQSEAPPAMGATSSMLQLLRSTILSKNQKRNETVALMREIFPRIFWISSRVRWGLYSALPGQQSRRSAVAAASRAVAEQEARAQEWMAHVARLQHRLDQLARLWDEMRCLINQWLID